MKVDCFTLYNQQELQNQYHLYSVFIDVMYSWLFFHMNSLEVFLTGVSHFFQKGCLEVLGFAPSRLNLFPAINAIFFPAIIYWIYFSIQGRFPYSISLNHLRILTIKNNQRFLLDIFMMIKNGKKEKNLSLNGDL